MGKGRPLAFSIMSRVNMERVLEVENHHFMAIIVKIDSGNSLHWKLNLGEVLNQEQDVFMVLESVSPINCSLVANETNTVIVQ